MSQLADNARAYLGGITKGDMDEAVRGFAETAVMVFPFSVLPVDEAEGRDAIAETMAPVTKAMSRRDFRDVRVTEAGPDLAILDFESDFEMADGRGAYRNAYHCVVEGRGGEIMRWTEYYDPRIAAPAVGKEAVNTGIVLDYAQSFQKEDARSLVERLFHPDAEYLVNLPREQSPETIDAIPWAGLWKGRDQLVEFEEVFGRNWTVDAIEPGDVIAKDDGVIVFGRMTLTAKGTGKKADTPMMLRFTLKDGKIARYHLMEDTYGVVLSHRSSGTFTIENDGRPRPAPPAGLQE